MEVPWRIRSKTSNPWSSAYCQENKRARHEKERLEEVFDLRKEVKDLKKKVRELIKLFQMNNVQVQGPTCATVAQVNMSMSTVTTTIPRDETGAWRECIMPL